MGDTLRDDTAELVAFLQARLDEDREAASKASVMPGTWPKRSGHEACDSDCHVVRHDPARVLREVEAKRRIVDKIIPQMRQDEELIEGEWGPSSNPDHVNPSVLLLRSLASIWSDHPDYPAYLKELRP